MKAIQTFLRILLLSLGFASLGLGMSSCRTTRGFGQDLQHLGAKIERKAGQVGRY